MVQPNKFSEQPNKSPEQPNDKETTPAKEFIRVNKTVSEELDQAAKIIDKNLFPEVKGINENNETEIYFVLGGDFADNGDIKTNFRYGIKLHLPRLEKYWKVKFANQDERRKRGRSSVASDERTRNANDDIFVGISFARNWDRIDIDYKPQIVIDKGAGLDHSVEASTEYKFGKFNIEPRLEFFANHDEGTGSSASLKFIYWLYKRTIALEQINDARYLNLSSKLAENHSAGIACFLTDRMNFSAYYFRSFRNEANGYELSAYGGFITANYVIYRKILSVEVRPYIVHERDYNFEQITGVVANFRVSF